MTQHDWQRVASERIFFGHQSVGANILQGVSELASEQKGPAPRILEGTSPETLEGPALFAARLGRNGDPVSKINAFSAALSRGMGPQGGVALFKLCYTDIDGSTDVDTLFDKYREQIAAVKAAYPRLRIVHVTVPLTTAEPWLKSFVKSVLHRPTESALNGKRNRFNELLRREYDEIDPIFDLAAVESTRRDGTRSFVGSGSNPVYTLAPEYTDDGSHLNRTGRRAAAEAFVKVLASVASK